MRPFPFLQSNNVILVSRFFKPISVSFGGSKKRRKESSLDYVTVLPSVSRKEAKIK